MACYSPFIRIEDLTQWNKAKDGHKYHPAKIIKKDDLNDLEMLKKYDNAMHYKKTIIPCQKCIGCRLDYAKDWANRTYLESTLYKHNYFITLTYDEEHLEYNEELIDQDGRSWTDNGNFLPTIKTETFETFLNTLRKIFEREYHHKGIRFIGCGEYGEESARPHYHLILLNCPFPAETFFEPRIKNNNVYYRNTILERAWKKGISNICEANWQTMSYTARYITKKVNGEAEIELYYANGIIKEFFRQSRDPGIGKPYYDLHKEKIYESDSILISNKKGVHREKPPLYFDKLFEQENPEKWKEIKRKREQAAEYEMRQKVMQTSIFIRDQLKIEERSKAESTATLIREYEKSK